MSWWARHVTRSATLRKWLAWTALVLFIVIAVVAIIYTAGVAASAFTAAFSTAYGLTGSLMLAGSAAISAGVVAAATALPSLLLSLGWWGLVLTAFVMTLPLVAAYSASSFEELRIRKTLLSGALDLTPQTAVIRGESDENLQLTTLDSNFPCRTDLALLAADGKISVAQTAELIARGFRLPRLLK